MQSTHNFMHFKKNDQLHSFNILEVIDSEKCGYLNAPNLHFQDALPESTRSGVLNTAEMTMEELLSEMSINDRHIELENISVSEI